MTQVCVDHVPCSMEYVTTCVYHAYNTIFHAWNTQDVTYSTLRGTWSMRTHVTCMDIPHNLQAVIVHEIYMHEHMCDYGTAI